jgi:capsular polysaccharide biosynthesis protein
MQETKHAYEEIDLVALLIKVIKVVRKRLVLLIALLSVGALSGWLLTLLVFKPVYVSQMLIQSQVLSPTEVSALLKPIQLLAKENNRNLLEKYLAQPAEVVKHLVNIESKSTFENENTLDKVIRKDSSITIQVSVSDPAAFQGIEQGLVHFLENNPYVKRNTELYRQSQETILAQVLKEKIHLDSLKSQIEKAIARGQLTGIVPDIYSATIKLTLLETETRQKLALANDIEIMQGFTPYKYPLKAKPSTNILIATALAFLLWIMVVVVIEIKAIADKQELQSPV